MKRHQSLIPLSREHHAALVLARLLQTGAPAYKGMPSDPEGKLAYAFKFYENELTSHFAREEEIFQLVTGIDGSLDVMLQEIIAEHQEIHDLFSLVKKNIDLVKHLDSIGKLLESHIRKEERVLFPLIEVTCSGEQLDTIINLHHLYK